jgi:hypothetical protein
VDDRLDLHVVRVVERVEDRLGLLLGHEIPLSCEWGIVERVRAVSR